MLSIFWGSGSGVEEAFVTTHFETKKAITEGQICYCFLENILFSWAINRIQDMEKKKKKVGGGGESLARE